MRKEAFLSPRAYLIVWDSSCFVSTNQHKQTKYTPVNVHAIKKRIKIFAEKMVPWPFKGLRNWGVIYMEGLSEWYTDPHYSWHLGLLQSNKSARTKDLPWECQEQEECRCPMAQSAGIAHADMAFDKGHCVRGGIDEWMQWNRTNWHANQSRT